VPEVGGLFHQHSPNKVRPYLKQRKKSDAKAMQLAAHSLTFRRACIGFMHLSALATELEIMGCSGTLESAREGAEKLREEFHLAVKPGSRDSWLRPAAEAP